MTRWQIFSACALRRLPELVPQMDVIETRVQNIYNAYEVAQSKLSQHELQHIEDKRLKESDDPDVIIKETAQDREDRWILEKSKFEFGPYDDRLTKVHYLFLKQKFGSDIKDQLLLPQAEYDAKQDQNLLETARRALLQSFNIYNGFKIVSKIPSSVYSFRYPKKITEMTGFHGAKVFFLKAHLDTPSDSVLAALDAAKNNNIRWLTKSEAFEVINRRYMTSLEQGLLHENRVDVKRVLERAARYAGSLNHHRQQGAVAQ